MKKYMMIAVALLSVMQIMAFAKLKKDPVYREARRNGAQAKIELHVADDDGTPVEYANVRAFLGMNFRPKGKWIEGTTDTNGVFVIEGKTCGDEIEVSVTKTGYYDSKVKYCYATMGAEHDVKDGKWQPYGALEKIKLRRILKPVALDSRGTLFDIPATNKWIAFDVIKMDWVRPHGTGEVNDLELKFEWDGLFQNISKFQNLQVRFPNCVDGAYISKNATYSNFMYSYTAQTNANYLNAFEFSMKRENGRYIANKLGDDSEMLCRLRSVTNKCGKVVSCSYARFRGLDFGGGVGKGNFYIFRDINPTSNDSNLEDEEIAKQSRHFIRHREPPGKGNLK